jgi:hypothetical protein
MLSRWRAPARRAGDQIESGGKDPVSLPMRGKWSGSVVAVMVNVAVQDRTPK